MIAHAVEVEADRVHHEHRRLVVKERGDERARARQIPGGDDRRVRGVRRLELGNVRRKVRRASGRNLLRRSVAPGRVHEHPSVPDFGVISVGEHHATGSRRRFEVAVKIVDGEDLYLDGLSIATRLVGGCIDDRDDGVVARTGEDEGDACSRKRR